MLAWQIASATVLLCCRPLLVQSGGSSSGDAPGGLAFCILDILDNCAARYHIRQNDLPPFPLHVTYWSRRVKTSDGPVLAVADGAIKPSLSAVAPDATCKDVSSTRTDCANICGCNNNTTIVAPRLSATVHDPALSISGCAIKPTLSAVARDAACKDASSSRTDCANICGYHDSMKTIAAPRPSIVYVSVKPPKHIFDAVAMGQKKGRVAVYKNLGLAGDDEAQAMANLIPALKESYGGVLPSAVQLKKDGTKTERLVSQPQSKPVFVHVSKDHSASLNCVKCATQTSSLCG